MVFSECIGADKYNDLKNGIYATNEYLEKFFALLMGTEYELKNRYMHVGYMSGSESFQSVREPEPKYDIETLKKGMYLKSE